MPPFRENNFPLVARIRSFFVGLLFNASPCFFCVLYRFGQVPPKNNLKSCGGEGLVRRVSEGPVPDFWNFLVFVSFFLVFSIFFCFPCDPLFVFLVILVISLFFGFLGMLHCLTVTRKEEEEEDSREDSNEFLLGIYLQSDRKGRGLQRGFWWISNLKLIKE